MTGGQEWQYVTARGNRSIYAVTRENKTGGQAYERNN